MANEFVLEVDENISYEALLDDLAREQESDLSGVAGFVSTNGNYQKLFDYQYEGDTNSFIITPTDLGKRLSNNFFKSHEGSGFESSIKLELNEFNIAQLSNIFQVPAYSTQDVKNNLGIHQGFNDPDHFIDAVSKKSPLLLGKEEQIEEKLEVKKIVLKEDVLDAIPGKDKPLIKGNEVYRYDNNQLVSMSVKSGGLENAFKYAALEALSRKGIDVGQSRVVRSPSKGSDYFYLLSDNQNENVLPATKSESGDHYQVYERFNQARRLPVDFKHSIAASGSKFTAVDPTASANRILRILESKSPNLHENFVTALMFNKLVGSKDFNAENVALNIDVDHLGMINGKVDLKAAFIPDFTFTTDGPSLTDTGVSPMMSNLSNFVAADPVIRELNEVHPELLEKAFTRAIEVRSEMLQIIASEMVIDGTLEPHEADQFSTYLLQQQGNYDGFSADSTDKQIAFEVSEDNQQRFQERFSGYTSDSEVGFN